MTYTKITNFKATYKGKTYFKVAEFAKACGLNTRLVLARWQRGFTDPKFLAMPPLKPGESIRVNRGRIPISYKGIEYNSLHDFSRHFGLRYTKVLNQYNCGITDASKLVKLCKPKNDKRAFQERKTIDEKKKLGIIHAHGFLAVEEVAKLTGLDDQKMRELVGRITRKNKATDKSDKRFKKAVTNLGLAKSDVVRFKPSTSEKRAISNIIAIPKFVLRHSAVKHIKDRLDQFKKAKLVPVPFVNDHYFFDPKDNTVWSSYQKNIFRKLKPIENRYSLKNKGKSYTFSQGHLEDLIKFPQVKEKDLLSRKEILSICSINRNYFDNHKFSHLLPEKHRRYDYRTGNAKIGWTRQEIIKGFNRNKLANKFVGRFKK